MFHYSYQMQIYKFYKYNRLFLNKIFEITFKIDPTTNFSTLIFLNIFINTI